MGILIQGGRIVDAATDTDKKGDIYLEDGVITEIGEKLKIKDKSDKVIDAKGCLVMPGSSISRSNSSIRFSLLARSK